MTVAQLIQRLRRLPQERAIFIYDAMDKDYQDIDVIGLATVNSAADGKVYAEEWRSGTKVEIVRLAVRSRNETPLNE